MASARVALHPYTHLVGSPSRTAHACHPQSLSAYIFGLVVMM